MEFLYLDAKLCVCVKPAGILSTDEPGGMPDLVRAALGPGAGCVYTVHRLDRVVGGVMALARTRRAAGDLSAQIREGRFRKEYLAVIHGRTPDIQGRFTDLLLRDKAERKTYVTHRTDKGAQEAVLDYARLAEAEGLTLVRIRLLTGRTHQIRAQFSARGLPLMGDGKYGAPAADCGVALWSYRLSFAHPKTGEVLDCTAAPPDVWPWTLFKDAGTAWDASDQKGM